MSRLVFCRLTAGGGGGAVGNGLTPSHYVAPYAEVPGASSDADPQDATAFSNATSASAPCTWQCAAVNASGSNIVQLGPGTYQKPKTTEDPTTAIFTSYNEGTNASSPLVFVAQYPAALNPTNSAVWTQVRRTSSDITDWIADQNSQPPLLGGGGVGSWKSHVIWDGFYFDMHVAPPSANGLVMLRGNGASGNGIGLKARRMLFDRHDWLASNSINLGGNNYNCIQMHTTTDVSVLDCWFREGYDTGDPSWNESCITQYACANYLVQNCTFEHTINGFYIKGGGGRDPYGTVKLNRFINVRRGIKCTANTATENTNITQNLFYFTTTPESNFDNFIEFDSLSVNQGWHVTSNTMALRSEGAGFYVARQDGSCTFRDNIVAHVAGTISAGVDGWYINASANMAAFGDIDYNFYWSHNGGNQFHEDGGDSTTIAAWRTATGDEGNSSLGTNPNFADQTDFRVSGTAATASSTGGRVGYDLTGSDVAGVRPNASY